MDIKSCAAARFSCESGKFYYAGKIRIFSSVFADEPKFSPISAVYKRHFTVIASQDPRVTFGQVRLHSRSDLLNVYQNNIWNYNCFANEVSNQIIPLISAYFKTLSFNVPHALTPALISHARFPFLEFLIALQNFTLVLVSGFGIFWGQQSTDASCRRAIGSPPAGWNVFCISPSRRFSGRTRPSAGLADFPIQPNKGRAPWLCHRYVVSYIFSCIWKYAIISAMYNIFYLKKKTLNIKKKWTGLWNITMFCCKLFTRHQKSAIQNMQRIFDSIKTYLTGDKFRLPKSRTKIYGILTNDSTRCIVIIIPIR